MTHRHTHRMILACAGVLLLSTGGMAQDDDRAFESESIRVGTLGARSPSSLRDSAWADDLRPLGLPLEDEQMHELLVDRDEDSYPGPHHTGEFSVELAMSFLPEEPFEVDGVALYAEGSRVHVRGPDELRAQVRKAVGAIQRTMDRTVVLRVRQLAFDAATWETLRGDLLRLAAGSADGTVMERLVANDQWSGARVAEVEIQPGTWGTLESIATERYLADLDAEIAQEAALYRPVIRTLREGYVLRIRPQLLHDGRVTVECSASEGEGAVRSGELDIGAEDDAALDRVRYTGTELAATFELGSAGAVRGWVSASTDTRGAARHIAWSMELLEVRGAARAGAFAVYPVGAIGAVGGLPRYQVSESADPPAPTRIPLLPEEEPRPPLRFLDSIVESLQSSVLDPNSDAGFLEPLLRWNGGCLLVHEEPPVLAAIETALSRMEATLIQSRTVTLRIDELAPDGTTTPRFETATGVLDGKTAAIGARRQGNLVTMLRPRTAQGSEIQDPETAVLDLGTFVNLTTEVADDGRVRVELDLRMRMDKGGRAARVPAAGASLVELPALLDLVRAQTLTLPVGESRRIELGPAVTAGHRLVATLRVD